jgi:7-cyano-7-deazaguanine synthase
MAASTTAVLYSGGIDSGILLAELAARGPVVPVYVESGLAWQTAEREAARGFASHLAGRLPVADLVVLGLPAADLYGNHWSVSGHGVPAHDSPDEAVELPGRNALLAVKPLIWCGMHGVERLALATLAGNPFADATPEFFTAFSRAVSLGLGRTVTVVAPFAVLTKRDVMLRGRDLPLAATFSCIAPPQAVGSPSHCGRCNKCAERRRAFAAAGLPDATAYAASPVAAGRATCPAG